MITAASLTDEQIHALWREALGTSLADVDQDLMHECNVAVNFHRDFSEPRQRLARERLAHCLNARNAKEQS